MDAGELNLRHPTQRCPLNGASQVGVMPRKLRLGGAVNSLGTLVSGDLR